jgi:hypothetical protein
MQYGFGIGNLFGVRTDVTPNLTVPFGTIQEVNFDLSFEIKELYGQYQIPLAVARAKAKLQGKAKLARINTGVFNNLFFGGTQATGETIVNPQSVSSIPATPFQVTIAPPNSGVFAADLGVQFSASGINLVKVASGPTTGQYSIAGAVYTFAAADTLLGILISYSYTIATGQTLTYTNQLMGAAPQFQIHWQDVYQGNNCYLKLVNCISTKFTLPMKLDDFTVPELDFSAFADAAGNVLTLSFAE